MGYSLSYARMDGILASLAGRFRVFAPKADARGKLVRYGEIGSASQIVYRRQSDFSPKEIREIRLRSAMTQSVFAACIGVTKKAVESWEGGRSHPDGAARRTLSLMSRNPHFAEANGILE